MNLRRRILIPALLLAAAAAFAADGPRITYTKSFPRSQPEWVQIAVDKSGHCEYRETPEEEPLTFQLSPKETDELFGMAERLDRFSKPLEAPIKVANTGMKSFRWENGAEKNEVKFNYSQVPDAKLIWDFFERITETEQIYIALERSAKFEKLGVNHALVDLQIASDRKRLMAASQFLPLLDRIVKNDTYLHMARERAASLADEFRKSGSE